MLDQYNHHLCSPHRIDPYQLDRMCRTLSIKRSRTYPVQARDINQYMYKGIGNVLNDGKIGIAR